MTDAAAEIEEFFERLDGYVAEVVAGAGDDGITRAELRRTLPAMSAKSPDALDHALARLRVDGRIGMDKRQRPNSRGVACDQWVIRSA